MKKIINIADEVVNDMIEGLVAANSNLLKRVDGFNVIVRKNKSDNDKVALVTGGGSGHEPAHAGYVGEGMLDAAVCGNVFASPSPDQIIEGIKAAEMGKGVLLIIKNYSGDIMNFDMARELAEMEDISVETVVVNDDVAVEDSTYTTGRRGIAGTVFVHKVAGAMAEKGADLAEVKRVAQKVVDNVRSMGMAMSSCIIPAVGKPGFSLGDDEVEIGMGIHGEPGVERTSVKSAVELSEILTSRVLEDLPFKEGDEVALMINGLGSTPLMEQYILNREVHRFLTEKGIKVYRTYVGNYMTALEMSGCSVSLLKLDEELKELLGAPAETAALTQRCKGVCK